MKDKHEMVFIEVRYRQSKAFLSPIDSITPIKQQRIVQTAIHFLQSKDLQDHIACRFDAIGLSKQGTTCNYEWVKQAFDADILF